MKRISIIGAMDVEIAGFVNKLIGVKEEKDGDFTFYIGKFFGKDVVLTKSGVGKVAASMVTQKLIDKYNPRALIFTGVAGALRNDLRVGDIVVSRDCVQHDVDVTALGLSCGEIPELGRIFKADAKLVGIALETEIGAKKIISGRILSGDQFYTEKQTIARRYLFHELKGDAIEMEGAAFAQVCSFNNISFIVVRTICSELHGNQEEQYRSFLPLVAGNSLKVVKNILLNI